MAVDKTPRERGVASTHTHTHTDDSMKIEAIGWKAIADMAKTEMEAARIVAGTGLQIQDPATVTIEVEAAHGTITADAVISGRIAWASLAVLLASKVNPATLASVVADYNGGARPKLDALPAAQQVALGAIEAGLSSRKGSVKLTSKGVRCWYRVEGEAVDGLEVVA